MAHKLILTCTAFLMLFSAEAWSNEASKADLKVKITTEISAITVMHNGKPVVIQRNQNAENKIIEDYALTSRNCPPFCVQPMTLLPGVNTIGEIELLEFLKRKAAGDKNLLIIDSRTPDWVAKGTIPSAINLPWTQLYREASNFEPIVVESILTDRFGAKTEDGIWDFSDAKELVLFCNGPWCGQSPTNIKTLVSMGYPAHKIHWYRGGMQAWNALGLTTVTP
ncbi:MAG: rhodanese-like domain-containing protein [Thiomicrorhabdus chilensis]|uniref:rhodanese-like domain-containing protein n=1 Tax=Thiomicrorhabdus chilensis TaxID=63656 RepID=UPI00299DBD42|nr:rhodanese-like domain-containing protein [Thiomicrorhabdus chilensis]MDX1348428.1 rhodanese-like domain-containing protein [Thiomicrorhabdus chilensis]